MSKRSKNTTTTSNTNNEYENPWESAANDTLWNSNTNTNGNDNRTPLLTSSTNNNNSTVMEQEQEESQNNHGCYYHVFQLFIVGDVLVGLAWLLYLYVFGQYHHHHGQSFYATHQIWTMMLTGLAVVLIVRGILAKWCSWGIGLSALISQALSYMWFMIASVDSIVVLVLWIEHRHGKESPTPAWLVPPFLPYLSENTHLIWVPIVYLSLALLEWIRWKWIQQWILQQQEDEELQQRLLLLEGMEYSLLQQQQQRRHQYRSRPHWWWNHNTAPTTQTLSTNTPTRPRRGLLFGQPHWTSANSTAYHMEDGIVMDHTNTTTNNNNNNATSGSWFGGWSFGGGGRGRGNNTNNPRDDGSVDYASLNEDWASRSEEDPFWWTREDHENEEHASSSQ